MLHDRRTWWWK